jgi:manganese transport protein
MRFGPAIVVAAVVLGPGSILTSSKVGATFGLAGVPVVVLAATLMIGMVALAARVGAIYEGSACDELASRLGRPVAVVVGLILFLVVALFQSSNNIAIVAGFSPLVEMATGGEAPGLAGKIAVLVGFNLFVIVVFYLVRNLYRSIERLMKILVGVMVLAFLVNFLVAHLMPRDFEYSPPRERGDLLALLGMIGTTFSVAGAFYQSYLVKEKGWGISDARRGLADSVVSISVLGVATLLILLTATRVFYGRPEPIPLVGVDDVARQLEPLFGAWATVVFSVGIVAGAFSSFLVNSMIGGTVMADSLGKGSRLSDAWPIHLTTLALLVGMTVAILSLISQDSTVALITLAQALTVLGIPALGLALLYLGTRPELVGERKVPRWILVVAGVGFLTSCVLAARTAMAVVEKIQAG